jgi:hypothetical protein
MIDPKALLKDLKPLVTRFEDDLRTRIATTPALSALLQADYDAARKANRTAQTLAAFTDEHITQIAVAWILATVFVRFVEDNELCGEPWLAGPGKRLAQARDRYTHWLPLHKTETEREYLLHVFTELGKLPGLAPLLGPQNTLLHRIGPSADMASELRAFWLAVDGQGDTSHLRHDFRDPSWDTRFLGDLYQDLSESAQKKFALLQTPHFIEEFILDRTLEPAIAEFGLADVRLIDPACGSGHFLLGAFARLFAHWTRLEPGTPLQQRTRKALDAVAGVDLNPFAVAIARFRLLVAALQACGETRLANAYDYRPKVAAGDSLLHSVTALGMTGVHQRDWTKQDELQHFYGSEDKELLREVFGRRYHAVVGNPPYIVARDKALNALYRANFPDVCHRQYSLGVPFTQAFFELARHETSTERRAPGFVGMITANSFMKREFGSKLIEEYLNKRVELSHVLDLSGAYIPGHGTPTVILEGRPRTATTQTIRAVLGIKGEPSTPDDPAKGLVWSAIAEQVDEPGSESEYVSCADVARERFATHPWSIGGGGAADLKDLVESECEGTLNDIAESIGFVCITKADEVFAQPRGFFERHRAEGSAIRTFGMGEDVRDWTVQSPLDVAFPYDESIDTLPESALPSLLRIFWPFRTTLEDRKVFGGQNYREAGKPWFEYGQIPKDKLRTPLSIAFAEVATHNHFVLDRGGKVFNRTAPVIKLPAGATEDEHLGLLGLLNSSTACFWLQQVCHNKGGPGGGSSKDEKWHDFFAFNGSNLQSMPLPNGRPLALARRLDHAAGRLDACEPRSILDAGARSRAALDTAKNTAASIRAEMIFLQEELDWLCHRLYGLLKDDLTYHGSDAHSILVGERAFEIVMAKQVDDGKLQTKWFEWLHATPITEVPRTWPKAYRDLVQRRVDLIQSNRDLALVEQMQCKRRWEAEPWEKGEQAALRSWLLDRMEDPKFWPEPKLLSTARFAEKLRLDPDFVQVSNLYRGRDDHNFDDLVRELVESEAVPFLPVLRYKPSGLRKRADWEATWALQRREDTGEKVGSIPVPPKYTSADFLKSSYWSLRGKLDVPKERFVLYPSAERSDDPTPVFTWAGFDHAQQARALAERYLERKEQDAATPDQLVPLLAGLRELVPWLLQWHNDPKDGDAGFGTAYQDFVKTELHALGKSLSDLTTWTPPARTRGKRAGSKDKKSAATADAVPTTDNET